MKFHNVSKLIRDARAKMDFSQADLAKRTGCPNQQISNIERAQQGIPDYKVKRFAKALNIETEVILTAIVHDFSYSLYKSVGEKFSWN